MEIIKENIENKAFDVRVRTVEPYRGNQIVCVSMTIPVAEFEEFIRRVDPDKIEMSEQYKKLLDVRNLGYGWTSSPIPYWDFFAKIGA